MRTNDIRELFASERGGDLWAAQHRGREEGNRRRWGKSVFFRLLWKHSILCLSSWLFLRFSLFLIFSNWLCSALVWFCLYLSCRSVQWAWICRLISLSRLEKFFANISQMFLPSPLIFPFGTPTKGVRLWENVLHDLFFPFFFLSVLQFWHFLLNCLCMH